MNFRHGIILLAEVEEIIIFVEGNRFHVDLKVGERGKYIRDDNINNARRNENVVMRVRLYFKISEERERNCSYLCKS